MGLENYAKKRALRAVLFHAERDFAQRKGDEEKNIEQEIRNDEEGSNCSMLNHRSF
jgi:hypothetical protein